MATTFPYFYEEINEYINDEDEQKIVSDVMQLEAQELNDLAREMVARTTINRAFASTRRYILTCKAGIWRAHLLKKMGPKSTIIDRILGFMGGWVLADEFWKRHGK